jgi:hypothetical protein
MIFTEQLVVARKREVLGLKSDRDAGYLYTGFRNFCQFL